MGDTDVIGDGSRKFAARWDRRDDFVEADYGVIGEDVDGVWCTIHPDVLGVEYSERCGEAMALFSLGLEPTVDAFERLSEATIQGVSVLKCAAERDSIRRSKERASDGN